MNSPYANYEANDDIVTLLLDDHARVRRLFAELKAAGDCPACLSAVWTELACVLLAHLDAAEEICYLPIFEGTLNRALATGDLAAHKQDAYDAVAEARLHDPGSLLWWLAVRAARDAARRHAAAVESGPLPEFRRQVPDWTRRTLGRQWSRFMSDLSLDNR